MSDDRYSDRADALNEALHLITGDRNVSYGPPTQDFDRAAGILQSMGYRAAGGRDLTGHDIALMVMAVKMSRLVWTPEKRDSWVDIAGYAGCGYECAMAEQHVGETVTPTSSTPDVITVGDLQIGVITDTNIEPGTILIGADGPADEGQPIRDYAVGTKIRQLGYPATQAATVTHEPNAEGIGRATYNLNAIPFRFDVANWVVVEGA